MSFFHSHCDVINNGKVTLEDYDVIICAISRFWKFTPQIFSQILKLVRPYFELYSTQTYFENHLKCNMSRYDCKANLNQVTH